MEREDNANLNLNFFKLLVARFFMYDPVNTNHEIFDLAETRGGGHEISKKTGSNSSYSVLGTTLSIKPNYNRLLCAHYLPADRAD